MSNRKKAEKLILEFISDIDPGKDNIDLYKDKFKEMSDKEFDELMTAFETGDDFLRLVVPNGSEKQLSLDHVFKVAKKYKHEFLESIWITDDKTGVRYLTPPKYLTVTLPVRAQNQLLMKKISIPKNNDTIDLTTGQPTGDSKGSAISLPEAQLLMSMGLEETLLETMKIRGGDSKAMSVFDKSIYETGVGDSEAAMATGTKVRSAESLYYYMAGMGIKTDILG